MTNGRAIDGRDLKRRIAQLERELAARDTFLRTLGRLLDPELVMSVEPRESGEVDFILRSPSLGMFLDARKEIAALREMILEEERALAGDRQSY
jgi:hypothetical protein